MSWRKESQVGEEVNERAHEFDRWLARNAERAPDKPFIIAVDQGETISHGAMRETANRIAHFLQRRGIGANARVALLANNSIEHLAVYFATMAHGATLCTIHVEMNHLHLEEILAAVAPALVLYESGLGVEALVARHGAEAYALGEWAPGGGSGFFAELARLPATPLAPVNRFDDDASIFYTSGTAEKPKGVVCTFRELIENTEATVAAFRLGPDDRFLDFRSYNWMSAQVLSALGTLCTGGTLVMARRFSQSRFFDWVREHRVTAAAGNPTTVNMLINRPHAVTAAELPHLRYVTSSSAPLMVAEWKRFEELYGIPIAQGYGTSETGWIAGACERSRRLGSVGRPLPYRAVTVVDEAGHALPVGEIGAVEVGGPPDCAFRYLAPDGTIRVNGKGRTRTGDLGYFDADGYLYLTGRAKDLIIRGGINISPLEIDNAVLALPEVAEAASIGVPDPIHGEAVVLYIVAKPGAVLTPEAVRAHCETSLALPKRPAEILFAESLPKTERGKLDRKALRALWLAEHKASA